ncbi:DUF7373 family lipoprotein [Nocardia rhizosphaerae]|uniref:Uncharacterized protein n=1 Tax=Nocardia rhizosphaerae TaxID=1691571 RepID=A0ABV8L2A2_9NOCA
MRKIFAYSTVAAIAIALSGCGDNADSATTTAPRVDVAQLDSGNYPTTPTDLEATRTAMSGAVREGIRIGNASPTPYDYDTRFPFSKRPGDAVTAENPPYFSGTGFENGKDTLDAIPGVVAGWETSANRREQFGAGREIDTVVVRYASGDQSRFAAEELGRRTAGVPGEIPGYPDAQVRIDITKGSYTTQYLRAWLVRGDLLIHAHLSDPVSVPFDATANADIVKRFFDKQLAMLESYEPTPLADIENLPLDVDGILSRTLPVTDDPAAGAIYPTQALLHLASRPDKLAAAIADAGVDYAAFATGSVFRTRDAEAAIRYMAAEEADSTTNPDYTQVDGPPDMPGAHCYDAKPEVTYASSTPPICITTVGRYVIKSRSMNLQDAYQRLAAQYKLLDGFS